MTDKIRRFFISRMENKSLSSKVETTEAADFSSLAEEPSAGKDVEARISFVIAYDMISNMSIREHIFQT